jgi:hypothetical protein
MTVGLSGVCFIVAAILFALAAIPPAEPYHSRIVAVGLAFFAAGHALP